MSGHVNVAGCFKVDKGRVFSQGHVHTIYDDDYAVFWSNKVSAIPGRYDAP